MKPIAFPRDESSHNSAIEWWYLNSHLKAKNGCRFSLMNVLFKIYPKKVRIPLLEKVPYERHCFAHSIISDLKNRKSYPQVNYFSPLSEKSFSKPMLFIEYKDSVISKGSFNSVIERKSRSDYRVKTPMFDLDMKSNKSPLLENNAGYIEANARGGYYYSLTSLDSKGVLNIDGNQFKVTGRSWMDHQWTKEGIDAFYDPKYHWTWFSIQLDNNIEIVCFKAGNRKNIVCLVSASFDDNSQKSCHDLIITSTGTIWKSPVTLANYPLSYRIQVPSMDIDLNIEPELFEQEMLFGVINYWEGPIRVSGALGKKKVRGCGFLEIVGCPIGISKARLYSIEAKNKINGIPSCLTSGL